MQVQLLINTPGPASDRETSIRVLVDPVEAIAQHRTQQEHGISKERGQIATLVVPPKHLAGPGHDHELIAEDVLAEGEATEWNRRTPLSPPTARCIPVLDSPTGPLRAIEPPKAFTENRPPEGIG